MAEYAAAYGGLPRPTDPWPLVYALLRRLGRFEARMVLRGMDAASTGVSRALSAAFGGDTGAFDRVRSELAGKAYGDTKPGEDGGRYIENLAAQDRDDG